MPTSILKPAPSSTSYSSTLPTDAQFFPTEPSPSTPLPLPASSSTDTIDAGYSDPQGTLFSGPAARSRPSSVSTFRMRNRERSKSDLQRMSAEWDDGRERERGERRRASGSRSRRGGRRGSDASSVGGTEGTLTEGEEDAPNEERESAGRRKRAQSTTSTTGTRRSHRSSHSHSQRSKASHSHSRRSSRAGSDTSSPPTFLQNLSSALRGSRSRRSSSLPQSPFPVPHRTNSTDTASCNEEALSVSSSVSSSLEDPYGPYGSSSSSGHESSNDQSSSSSHDDGGTYRSRNRRRSVSAFLGGLPGMGGGGGDVFGGETRIEFDEDGDGFETNAEGLGEEAIGDGAGGEGGEGENRKERAYQPVYVPDEDLLLHLVPLRITRWRESVWKAGCVATVGGLWLLGRWVPGFWMDSVGRRGGRMGEADWIVVETQHHPPQLIEIRSLRLASPVPLSALFPPSVGSPPTHRDESLVVPTPRPNATSPDVKSRLVEEVEYIDYRYYRFLLHPEEGDWRMVREWKDPTWLTLPSLRLGLSASAVVLRESLFGSNVIEVAGRGWFTLLVDEVLHPFYIFQILSIILWSIDNYYYYAFAIALISVVSIVATLVETKNNIERMREMSRFSCPVLVLRDSEWITTSSTSLVPGDLLDLSLPSLHTFPADLILLSGDAIVNESMLTGESIPVSKVPIELAAIHLVSEAGGEVHPDLGRHVVFSGTKIVRIRKTMPAGGGAGGTEALAMVMRTGFNTTKGALVRSMLFPKPFGFAFYRDSFRFIGVLAIIALLGFLASSYNFVKMGISWNVIILRALDLVTIVVPPALPATMSIGTSFAIARLRKIGIYCISPNRVNLGGKVNIVCFDKTGTLTEEGLDVLGIRSVVRSQNKFTQLLRDADDVPIFGVEDAKTPLLHALATCHALKIVGGEVIGDPLDLRMFEFTNWTLEEGKEGTSKPTEAPKSGTPGRKVPATSKVPERAATLVQMVARPPGGESFKLEDALKAGSKHAHFLELGVLRTFDFVSSLRRMSVLVKKLKSNSVEAYVKGAPEVMSEICDKSTLPEDYEEMLSFYTQHGYRVIALAGKSMPGLTWIKAQRLKRDAVECDLRFLGLIIFENKLKPGTTPAIATLRSAHIPTRMVTGDNVRTAISVGRECGMVSQTSRVFLPTFLKGNSSTPQSLIEWVDVEDESRKLDSYSLKPIESDTVTLNGSIYSDEPREYHLAVSGDAFRWMMDFGPLETLQRMLIKGIIFARMSPDEKHELVERLQSLGYVVGFCGDGANDCGALKAADVGVSLSEAEASVAAPFTSQMPDIRCFVEVIREGRAALVTSFSCFKFMALYSLIQFTTVTLLYAIASTLGDFQFLYIDLFLILPIAVTMGRTEAFPRIHPKRPTANLISKKVLTSLIGQILISSGVQFFTFFHVRAQDWYVPPIIDPTELDIVSFENTALFLVSSFQYIMVAAIFCVGPPYRKSLHTNRWLVFVLLSLTLFSLYTLLSTHGPIFLLLQLISLPHEFHLELVLLLLANVSISWAFEKYGVEVVAKWVGDGLKKMRKMRGRRREGKVYKAVQRDMDD